MVPGSRATRSAGMTARCVSHDALRIYLPMRAEDLLLPTPQGLCCPPGGFHIDPLRPVERALITHGHSDHARAGHGAVLATAETLDIMRLRCGEAMHGTTQAARYGETLEHQRRRRSPSDRPAISSVRRRSASNGTACASSPPATTRTSPIRPARPSSPSAATCSSPRRPSGCRCSGIPIRGRDPQAARVGRAVSRARAPGRRLCARQGAARDRACCARPDMTGRSICTARWRSLTHYYVERGIDLGELRPVRDAKKADLAGTIALCPPSALQDRVDAPLPRAGHDLRVRLDAGARPRAPARRRTAARHLRPRRLGRAHAPPSRQPARPKSGSRTAKRTRWCTGAMTRGIPARPLRLVGYGEEERGQH